LKGESVPYGSQTWGVSKKGKRGETIEVWGKAGDFDTKDRKEITFVDQFFRLP
jgi:hypothetical protein